MLPNDLTTIKDIEIWLIYRSSNARKTNGIKVDEIAASIRDVGLLNPISVRAGVHHRGTTPFDAFDIVSGHHRYEAVRSLKWTTVPCRVLDLDDLHAELAEIDENLMRSDRAGGGGESNLPAQGDIREAAPRDEATICRYGQSVFCQCDRRRHRQRQAHHRARRRSREGSGGRS